MDGLTIRNAEGLIQRGETLSDIRKSEIAPNSASNEVGSSSETPKSFAATLTDAIQNVNELQKGSDAMMQKLATGKTDNIPEVMIAAEKADIALKLMVQMRNKVIDAYQEVMKMQL